MSHLDPPDTYDDDVEEHLSAAERQVEADAAISAAEDRHEEHRQFAREEALMFLRAELYDLHSTDVPAEPVALLIDWIDDLRRSHQAQQDRITALLTAVDYLRPPF